MAEKKAGFIRWVKCFLGIHVYDFFKDELSREVGACRYCMTIKYF